MKNKKRLSAREVGRLLGTPMVTVLRWAHQGKIPCKLKETRYVFKESEIREWAGAHNFSLADRETRDSGKEPGGERQEEDHSLKKTIERGGVIRDLEGNDIYSVLKHALDRAKLPEGTDRELVLNELLNREEIASTSIGKGVAIPHPRHTLNLNLEYPVITAAFLEHPVDFNAVDGEDIFVIFMMLSPSTPIHLKLLSRLSLCLQDKKFFALLENRDPANKWLARIEEIERKLASE